MLFSVVDKGVERLSSQLLAHEIHDFCLSLLCWSTVCDPCSSEASSLWFYRSCQGMTTMCERISPLFFIYQLPIAAVKRTYFTQINDLKERKHFPFNLHQRANKLYNCWSMSRQILKYKMFRLFFSSQSQPSYILKRYSSPWIKAGYLILIFKCTRTVSTWSRAANSFSPETRWRDVFSVT